MVENLTKVIRLGMYKFIMFFELFFCNFRAFNFSRCVNRVYNHIFSSFSIREIFIRISDSFFHKVIPYSVNYSIITKTILTEYPNDRKRF